MLNSKLIDQVVVNTDCEKIISIIHERYDNKVLIHKRPENLCGDFIPMNEIIKYDLGKLNSEHYIQTHSTNPLFRASTFDKAIQKYWVKINKNDSMFSVTRLQTRLFNQNGYPINHEAGELIPTQRLEPVFEENSNFYIFSRSSFINASNNRIGLKPNMFEVNKLECQDIDNDEDFILAEILYKNRSVYYESQEKTTK